MGTEQEEIGWHIFAGDEKQMDAILANDDLRTIAYVNDKRCSRRIAAVPRLVQALKEAEAGLKFAGADLFSPKGDFVPATTLALIEVREALALIAEPSESDAPPSAITRILLVLDADDARTLREEFAKRKDRELPEGQSGEEGAMLAECIRDLNDYRSLYEADHPRKAAT